MNKAILTSTLAVTLLAATPGHAWFGSKKTTQQTQDILNLQVSNATEIQSRQVLQDLSTKMTQRLNDIQTALDTHQENYAMSLAKNTLDEVKIKTGIDPKAKLREKFLVPTVFPENTKSMDSLSEDQKNLIIQTIKDFRGGLYLDIVNLSKRTTLLYIKALHAVIIKSGSLMIEDRNKIIKDLATISIFPMPVQDKKGQTITVYDDQVANEDHVYMFNREIKMYLLNAKDLGISEVDFIKYRDSLRGFSSRNISSSTSGEICMKNASSLYNVRDMNSAEVGCFQKYADTTSSMNQCMSLANAIYNVNDMAQAQAVCFNKFN